MKKSTLAFSLLAAALLAGCAAPKTSGIWIEKGCLHLEDPAFAANIELIEDAREKTPEGFLHAQVQVQNKIDKDLFCQYKFEWKDKKGLLLVHQPMPWTPLVLHGNEILELDGVSILEKAEDFRLKIRRAD